MENFMRKYGGLFYNYEEFHKAEIDELVDAKALEIAEGIAKDMAKDMAKDIAKDMAKDMAKDKDIATAKKLCEIGILSIEQIADITDLSIEEIKKLKSKTK